MWPWLLAALMLSAAGTWGARRYALHRQLIDEPGERRSHAVATPRGGGVGPVLGIAAAMVWAWRSGAISGGAVSLMVAGLIAVALIGWWDDHRPLPALPRLAVHLAAGLALATAFGTWADGVFAGMTVVLTTVALVNIWNFMDGIDGIAASQAMLVAVAAAVLLPEPVAWTAAGIGVACLAFLPFNFPRASIFLGDVGSGALGYALAALAASAWRFSAGPVDLLLLALPMAPFVIDASLTLARRALRGERWWTPHTQHFYQGWARRAGHVPVTLAYGTVSAAAVVTAAMLQRFGAGVIIACTAAWYTALVALWFMLQRQVAQKDASR